MKSKSLFLAIVLCLFGLQVKGQVTTLGNDISSSPNAYLGSSNSTPVYSSTSDVIFKKGGQLSGRISQTSLTLGYGAGISLPSTNSNNVILGPSAGSLLTTASLNVIVGQSAASKATSASRSVVIGRSACESSLSIVESVYIGENTGDFSSGGSLNTFVGYHTASRFTNGSNNTFLGSYAGINNSNEPQTSTNFSSGNTFVGAYCGFVGNGSGNTFIGKANTISPVNGTIILADGSGSPATGGGEQRLYIHSNGNAGFDIGKNNIPQNRLVINSTGLGVVAGTLGMRFNNVPTTLFSNTATNTTNKVLSVNPLGDVILVDDKQATNGVVGLTSTCSAINFIPKAVDTAGNLTCSQIFDNGTSVGIGSTGPFVFTTPVVTGQTGTLPSSTFTLKLDVNGVTRTNALFSTSDKKFKKNIKAIDTPLEKIMALEGKTYNWRKEEFTDKNFGSELQYGLIAQEVQKILPSLIIESDKGDLAMNYIAIIPVLIEAMKEQQTQINALKAQISNDFKTQNQDLVQFTNTKIINVSPNPSSDVILVSLNVDKAVATANLQVHDLNGTLLSSLNLKERDTNIVKSLQKDNFGKGIYIVSLIINGKSIDTKKIVFN